MMILNYIKNLINILVKILFSDVPLSANLKYNA